MAATIDLSHYTPQQRRHLRQRFQQLFRQQKAREAWLHAFAKALARGQANVAAAGTAGAPAPSAPPEGKAQLVCTGVGALVLPWWPSDVQRSNLTREYTDVERPGRAPLLVPGGKQLQEYSLGFVLRGTDLRTSMTEYVDLLGAIAGSKTPATLVLGRTTRGLFHVTDLSLVEVAHTAHGHPSVVDVALTLRQASDATIKVGPVPRKRASKLKPDPEKPQRRHSTDDRDRQRTGKGGAGSQTVGREPHNRLSSDWAKWFARNYMHQKYGWGDNQWQPLLNLWNRESGWNYKAYNGDSGATGIPQSLPGSKMSKFGADWRTNPETQIKWGLWYIKERYTTPAGAWAHSQATGWY